MDPYLSIRALGRLLRSGETSPTELTRFYLERLDSTGRELNLVVALTPERAEREASVAEAELRAGIDRGPLHGIPYGAKDILATIGTPTTWGAAPLREQTFEYDAVAVQRLRQAGAVLVAKLATIELAGGMSYNSANAALTGPPLNPWDRGRWTGGSSSGPAGAVAAGLVPFAIGSDTGGSIIGPASSTGVSGMRPTYGRIPRTGAMVLAWTLDRLGPMCRTADDCGLVLQAVAGPDPGDPASLTHPYRYKPARLASFRLATVPRAFEDMPPEVEVNFTRTLDQFREIGTLEEIELPDFPYGDLMSVILAAESYSAFDQFLAEGRSLELTNPGSKVTRLGARALPAHVYLRAQRIRRQLNGAMAGLLARYDAVLSPASGWIAAPVDREFPFMGGRTRTRSINFASNLGGLPAISVPNGFVDGLPTGLLITSRAYTDTTLLEVANAYQNRSDWQQRHPA